MDRTVELALPEELVALLGSAESAAQKAKEALVMDLLRERCLRREDAERLLGLTEWHATDLMAKHSIVQDAISADVWESAVAEARDLLELERKGVITLGTGRLPDDWLDWPRSADPTGSVRSALTEEREQGW